jgi:hypothetical protein
LWHILRLSCRLVLQQPLQKLRVLRQARRHSGPGTRHGDGQAVAGSAGAAHGGG